MIGDAQSHGVLAASDDIRNMLATRQDQRQRAWPEMAGQQFCRIRHLACPVAELRFIRQMHNQRMIGRAALDLENSPYRSRIGRVRTKAIYGLGGESHHPALAQDGSSSFDLGVQFGF